MKTYLFFPNCKVDAALYNSKPNFVFHFPTEEYYDWEKAVQDVHTEVRSLVYDSPVSPAIEETLHPAPL